MCVTAFQVSSSWLTDGTTEEDSWEGWAGAFMAGVGMFWVGTARGGEK